jgi:hypothetical protein
MKFIRLTFAGTGTSSDNPVKYAIVNPERINYIIEKSQYTEVYFEGCGENSILVKEIPFQICSMLGISVKNSK